MEVGGGAPLLNVILDIGRKKGVALGPRLLSLRTSDGRMGKRRCRSWQRRQSKFGVVNSMRPSKHRVDGHGVC
jgi:hypothetical protein